MKPIIIILKEDKDRGKTSTLLLLRDLLLAGPSSSVVGGPIAYGEGNDCTVVIDYRGKKVGMITIGDPGYETQFEQGYSFCSKNNCDIFVVAARPFMRYRGKETPYKLIWDHVENEGLHALETSTYVTYRDKGSIDVDILNALCAENLKRTIDKLYNY